MDNLRLLSSALSRCYALRLENERLKSRIAMLESEVRTLRSVPPPYSDGETFNFICIAFRIRSQYKKS